MCFGFIISSFIQIFGCINTINRIITQKFKTDDSEITFAKGDDKVTLRLHASQYSI